jgi:hypothetical protein
MLIDRLEFLTPFGHLAQISIDMGETPSFIQ